MRVGVATSEPETAVDGGGAFWQEVAALGLREVRLVAYRDNPALLARIRESLLLRPPGVLVSLVLIDSPAAPLAGFPEWAAMVASALPGVYRLIVWNEPNAHAFWPHPHGGTVAARATTYARLLNETTAAILAVRPKMLVSAFGLAASHEPVRFLKAAKAAGARLSSLSVHLYPGSPADGPKGALALLRRLEALVPLVPVYVDEFGWNVGPHCAEARQARVYAALLRDLHSDARVRAALVYRLHDGEGWTAGPHGPEGRRLSWPILAAASR